jgi:hypothetical protein
MDTDGLLDRLFKLSPTVAARNSFRELLQDSPQYLLRVIRDSLSKLLSSSGQPRALLAIGASNQQGFCDFSKSLFDEIAANGYDTGLSRIRTKKMQSNHSFLRIENENITANMISSPNLTLLITESKDQIIGFINPYVNPDTNKFAINRQS